MFNAFLGPDMRSRKKLRHITLVLMLIIGIDVSANAQTSLDTPENFFHFVAATCHNWNIEDLSPGDFTLNNSAREDIMLRGAKVGSRYRFQPERDIVVELEVINPTAGRPRFIGKLFDTSGNPRVLISLASDCSLQVARQVNYNADSQKISLVSLDKNLQPGTEDLLNPPLVFNSNETEISTAPMNKRAVRVAMVDSGVNYTLPHINHRLARDKQNRLIGYDFWDMDDTPYDANLVTSGFFVQRHGTRTASLLIEEAPHIELVPYRYPRPDMSRMKELIEHAAKHEVSIIGMPLGSNKEPEWGAFQAAAKNHPDILFIVSAGNDGRDIDKYPVYPAVLKLANMIVVTSADDYVRPADRTNWGTDSVDYMIPAEAIPVIDYSGSERKVSGSSYAVSRMTALAARIQLANPQWKARHIIKYIKKQYSLSSSSISKWVKSGYIPDPLAGAEIGKHFVANIDYSDAKWKENLKLSLEVLTLDARWSQSIVEEKIDQVDKILNQCQIAVEGVSIYSINSEDYLKDLTTGTAHTLLTATKSQQPTIVLARDTRMQLAYMGEAFGLGNTANRPWLRNSIWLIWDVDDAGIAMAHELYHVLANNGIHVDESTNLMQGETRPDGVNLTATQCVAARENGLKNQLLRE